MCLIEYFQVDPSDMNAKLQAKQRHLLELQKRKLELELAATKQRLEEQEKHLNFHADSTVITPSGSNISKFPGQIGGHVNASLNMMHVNRTLYDQYKGAMPQLPNMGNTGNMFAVSFLILSINARILQISLYLFRIMDNRRIT